MFTILTLCLLISLSLILFTFEYYFALWKRKGGNEQGSNQLNKWEISGLFGLNLYFIAIISLVLFKFYDIELNYFVNQTINDFTIEKVLIYSLTGLSFLLVTSFYFNEVKNYVNKCFD